MRFSGRKVLADVATIARPDTILGWYRKLVARKFDGSKARRRPGRPRIKREVEQLIIRMARENRDWGYDRIAGALANLGYEISDQTVGNVLRRHGLLPAPQRKRTTSWTDFIRTYVELLAGTDFFTADVLTLRGLVTYYVLFFIVLRIPPNWSVSIWRCYWDPYWGRPTERLRKSIKQEEYCWIWRTGRDSNPRLHSLLPPKLPPELAPCGGKNRDEATSLTSEVIDSREPTGRRGTVRNGWQRITKPLRFSVPTGNSVSVVTELVTEIFAFSRGSGPLFALVR
jgi:Homeodomain-like domain